MRVLGFAMGLMLAFAGPASLVTAVFARAEPAGGANTTLPEQIDLNELVLLIVEAIDLTIEIDPALLRSQGDNRRCSTSSEKREDHRQASNGDREQGRSSLWRAGPAKRPCQERKEDRAQNPWVGSRQ